MNRCTIFVDTDTRTVELFDLDGISDAPVKSIDLDVLMGRTSVEVVTKRGGYHDTCDILDTATLEWWQLEGDTYAETIDDQVREWANGLGWTVTHIDHL